MNILMVSYIPARGRDWTDLYFARGAQGVLPMRVGGATSQLDLPSLTPLSVAGCGRLQLRVPHWDTSVDYCKQLIIVPTFCGSSFPTGRLLAIEDVMLVFYISASGRCVGSVVVSPVHRGAFLYTIVSLWWLLHFQLKIVSVESI